MASKRRWWAVAGIVLLLAGGAWGGWHYTYGVRANAATTAKLAEIQQQFHQLAPGANSNLPPEKRRELMTDLRKKVEQLPPEQREQLREQQHEAMRKEYETRVHAFFALPPNQRTVALDKHIDDMQRQRQAWQQARAQSGGQTWGGNAANAGGHPAGNGPANPASQSTGQRPSGSPRPRSFDHQVINQRRAQRLDASTPETRAYRQLLNERMKARGITPPGRPR